MGFIYVAVVAFALFWGGVTVYNAGYEAGKIKKK